MPEFTQLKEIDEIIVDGVIAVDRRASPTFVLGDIWTFTPTHGKYYTAHRRTVYTLATPNRRRHDMLRLFQSGKLRSGRPKPSSDHERTLLYNTNTHKWYRAASVWPENLPCLVSDVLESIADVWFEE